MVKASRARRSQSPSPQLRQSRIAELVRKKGQVSVESLARGFNASQETIRRDLSALAESGLIQKVHGGAKLPRKRREDPFDQRMDHQSAAKHVIAQKLAERIAPGETLFLNNGTTTVIAAEALAPIERLTIITNSHRIAGILSAKAPHSEVFLLGGRYDTDNGETLGPMTLQSIRDFHADHAILTVAAVDARQGAMDANFEEAQISRRMIEQADSVYILADSSKLDRRAAFAVCPLETIDCLLAERLPDGALKNSLTRLGVEF